MAKRPAFTPDEARTYLAQHNYPGAADLSDKYAQRLARGQKRGLSVKATRGHLVTEHHYTRVQTVVYEPLHVKSGFAITEFRMGKAPDENRAPDDQRAAVPQPSDLLRLVRGHTHSPLINVGVVGFLSVYLNPDEEVNEYVGVHAWVERQWLIDRLAALPQNRVYQSDDPAYLDLAHDLVRASQNAINGQLANDTWQWAHVYQWSVRDLET